MEWLEYVLDDIVLISHPREHTLNQTLTEQCKTKITARRKRDWSIKPKSHKVKLATCKRVQSRLGI